jgi:hypothetical protein
MFPMDMYGTEGLVIRPGKVDRSLEDFLERISIEGSPERPDGV